MLHQSCLQIMAAALGKTHVTVTEQAYLDPDGDVHAFPLDEERESGSHDRFVRFVCMCVCAGMV